MANVKFNRGTLVSLTHLGSNPFDQLTLVRDNPRDTTGYNSIYLGTDLVGTSMLGLMKPQKMQTPTYTYNQQGQVTNISWSEATISTGLANIESGVITTDLITPSGGSATPMTTVRKLINYQDASSPVYSQYASDSEILTAKAVTALVAKLSDNTYYEGGGWNYQSSGWNTWTAIDVGTSTYDFSFTLPTEDSIATYNTNPDPDDTPIYGYHTDKIPTSKAVADFVEDYFGDLAGGMRYCGALSSALIQAGTKTGDVFIASSPFSIYEPDTSTIGWAVEIGDMIVIKGINSPTISVEELTSDKCDVFERNLTGSVTAPSDLGRNNMVVGNATDTKTIKTVDFVTADTQNNDIVITHNSQNIAVAESLMSLQWNELPTS
jgi:hypothetical protein